MSSFKARYDANLVVIGAGSAGLVSAYIAAAVKAKVILIEEHRMGGDCLNTGCVPSKALIRAAKAVHYARKADQFGINVGSIEVDFPRVMARVQEVIATIEPHDSVARYTDLGVDCRQGRAFIHSPHEVEVNGERIRTRHIIVATGARPAVPKIPGLAAIPYLSSDNLWSLKALPKDLVVLGGGPIGCELAQAFARLGSQVTIVDMAPALLPRADDDISTRLANNLAAEGVSLVLNAQVEGVQDKALNIRQQGQAKTLVFDRLLVAVGRQANTRGFGLEALGLALNDNGTIKVDRFLRSSIPNILACGDVAGPYQFTHTASHQAWYAAVNSLLSGIKSFKVDYAVIPWVIFTDPEVAHVGESEKELLARGAEFEVVQYELADLDRAIAEGDNRGVVRVMVRRGSDKILGATIMAAHAGEMIVEFVTAMKTGVGLNKILGTVHSYPTWSEANKYVAGNWKRGHAPQTLLRWVERFHTFRRR